MRIKSFLAAAAVSLSVFATHASAEDALRVGMAPEPYLPYSTLNSANQWEGFEPDLLRSLCAEIKARCDIAPIAWDGLIPSLTEKKVDLIMGAFSINEERKKAVNFSTAYSREATVLVGPKSDATKIGTIAEATHPTQMVVDAKTLSGKVLGAQSSSVQADYIQKYLPAVDRKNYDTADNVVADLVAGRVDYAVLPDTFTQTFLETKDGKDYEIKLIVPDNPVMGEGIGLAVRKDSSELLKRLNQGLKSLEANGQLAAISNKWFPNRK
jgi:polar amino acid transport system substrate-binding protein